MSETPDIHEVPETAQRELAEQPETAAVPEQPEAAAAAAEQPDAAAAAVEAAAAAKGKRGITGADIAKFSVLVAIIGGSIALTVFLWPYIKQLSTQEGMQELITTVRGTGPLAVGVLLVLQLAQVIIAFIPGEVVQVVAGILYGPVWGSIIILCGALGSTVIIYHLVQKLGTPFVSKMVPAETQEKLGFITRTSRIDAIVFVLFLIPGLPKDLITYLVALTDVRKSRFFFFSTLGRAPGVIVTSFAGHSLAGGNWVTLAIIVGIAVVILLAAFLLRGKIMAFFNNFADKHRKE